MIRAPQPIACPEDKGTVCVSSFLPVKLAKDLVSFPGVAETGFKGSLKPMKRSYVRAVAFKS